MFPGKDDPREVPTEVWRGGREAPKAPALGLLPPPLRRAFWPPSLTSPTCPSGDSLAGPSLWPLQGKEIVGGRCQTTQAARPLGGVLGKNLGVQNYMGVASAWPAWWGGASCSLLVSLPKGVCCAVSSLLARLSGTGTRAQWLAGPFDIWLVVPP